MDLWRTNKPETVATLMAQSALESGRWQSMFNFNVSNIKCEPTRAGLYTCFPLLNEIIKGKTVWFSDVAELTGKGGSPVGAVHPLPPGHPQSRFRAYDTLTDGVKDKLNFLNRTRYAVAKDAALGGSPGAYSRALSTAGYYTANVDSYTRSLVSLFSTYLPLCQTKAPDPVPLPEVEENRLCSDLAECMRVELPDWVTSRLTLLHEQHRGDMWDSLRDRGDSPERNT